MARVSQAYNNWLLAESHLLLVQSLDSLFRDFEAAAQLRFQTGATGKLEQLSASGQAQNVGVLLQQAKAEYAAATQNLKSWVNLDADVASREQGLFKFTEVFVADSAALSQNPLLAYYRQNLEVAEAALKVERAQFLPQLNLGYSDQTINGVDGFYLYRLGVNVPLLFFSQLGKKQAAQINTEIAEKELEGQLLTLKRQWSTAAAALEKAQASLMYYEQQGLALADELIRAANLGYRAGEVDYIAYIQNLNQAIQIRQGYLQSLEQYNRAVIELNFLSGQYLQQ